MTTSLRTARWGVTATFALAGLLFAVWTVRIPALTDKLRLDPGDLGLAVLLVGLGATVAMQATRVLLPRAGSRVVLAVSTPACAALLAGLGLAPTYPLLLVAAALFGLAFGAVDSSMNAQAAAIERAMGRHVMNGAHAGWSVGAVLGGGIGALTAQLGIGFTAAVTGTALVSLPVALALVPTYLPDGPAVAATGRRPTRLPRVVWVIGAVTLACFVVEGAVANWSGLYVYRDLGATEAVAALAYPSLEIAMIIGRTAGDRIRTAVGARVMLVASGLLIVAGMGLALAGAGWPVALAGFFTVGLGVATVVPITFSLAGDLDPSGAGIAQVGAMGYGGMLLGPALIGGLADATTLRTGLLPVFVLGAVIAVVGGRLRVPAKH